MSPHKMDERSLIYINVRLMEHYDLRSCFLPDLSGLHVRIYQFRQLLKIHLPDLSAHLDTIGVEPAYVSQWFLSFFAVTCPLPMLFRIYDVIFAEGASETIMRVALSLMRKNADKLMAYTEIEDVMQLLLSRGLWDVYQYNADAFVSDFTNMSGMVTRESLQQLEQAYREAQVAEAVSPSESVGTVATRFLGRLWAGSNSSTKSVNLSPGLTAPARPISFLRRSPSKQSMSTLNSMDGGASDSNLSTFTDATSVSRDSSNADGMSIRQSSVSYNNHASHIPKSNNDKNLHSQIEDLLTALSELQRDHAVLATQLQKEREDREEDRMAVRSLLDGLRKKASSDTIQRLEGEIPEINTNTVESGELPEDEGPDFDDLNGTGDDKTVTEERSDVLSMDLSHLLDIVEERFQPQTDKRASLIQSKSQLRDEVARAKEQLHIEVSKTQELSRQLSDNHQEIQNLKDQVREGHAHIRNAHGEKQRLERAVQELKTKKGVATTPDGSRDGDSEWPQRTSAPGGLRELRLGRTNSNRSQAPAFNKRTSSLSTAKEWEMQSPTSSPGSVSPQKGGGDVDTDLLVLELVQAKTAEAVARQDAEEARAKLEALRKAVGLSSPGDGRSALGAAQRSSSNGSQLSGIVGRGAMPTKVEMPATPAAGGGGGFWGGWGKRTVSSSGE